MGAIAEDTAKMKIAVITTALIPASHAAVIIRRWIDPLPSDAGYEWTGPRTEISTLFVLQEKGAEEELAKCRQAGIRLCGSVEEALTLNTGKLAVDAVMLIGEHGDFPTNAIGQKLYPRKELFDRVLAVFARAGRVTPLFFDKHFSWNAEAAREMYGALEAREIPWFGGSSLPYCPLVPPIEDLQGKILKEIVMTTWGDMESYLFHALEILESLAEKREGGETGIRSVIAWEGGQAWEAMRRGEFSRDLLVAALSSVSHETAATFLTWEAAREQNIQVFQLHYQDGLKATIVRLNGLLRKWAFGCHLADRETPIASAAEVGTATLYYPHFARLARRIEDFFLGSPSPIPKSRLYLTTLSTAYCMQALAAPGKMLAGSEIAIPPPQGAMPPNSPKNFLSA